MSSRQNLVMPMCAALMALGGVANAAPPETVTVGPGGSGGMLSATGQVVAVRQAELAAQAAGRVTDVLVRSGDPVHAGQVLLRIDSPSARAAAEAGGAQSSAAAAQLETARADFARTSRLHDKGYISDAAFERARAQLHATEAQATSAGSQAKAAREMAGWEELRAPYDGQVTDVRVAAGDLASPGEPLVGVYAQGPMRVLADLPDSLAGLVATDQPVSLAFDGNGCAGAPARTRDWTLVQAIDPHSRSVPLRVELPRAPGCLPGTLAHVGLALREGHSALTVPRSAVVSRGELTAVYVVDDAGRVALRQVRTGEAGDAGVEVLAGLEPGEHVVRDAARYRAAPAGAGAAAP